MGLLGENWDDPKSQAIMALSAGLLGRNFAGGLLGANQAYAQGKAAQQQAAMQQLQMKQMQMGLDREQRALEMDGALRQAAKDSFLTPERATALSMGPMPDGSNMPMVQPGFDMSGYVNRVMQIDPTKGIGLQQAMQKDDTPIPVAPGASLYSKKQNRVLFTAPDKAGKLPAEVQAYEYARGQGYQGTYEQWDRERKRAGAVKVEVPINMGQKGLDNELSLHSKWRQEPIYKAHQDVKSAYSQISAALAQQSPAGDLAGATKLMKILDPGSVVRESELGMAMAASGAMDRLVNYADKIIKGTKLTPTQRKDFQTLADSLNAESVKQYNAKRNEYAGFAKDYGLNADRIVGAEERGATVAKPTPSAGGTRRYNHATGRIE